MIDNKDLDKNLLEAKISKFTFIGFILGIMPFMILLSIVSIKEGGMKFVPGIFRDTLVIAGLIVSITNAYLLRKMIKSRFE